MSDEHHLMQITEISPITHDDLVRYARIPIVFEVTRIFDNLDEGYQNFVEREVSPYVKDYDALEHPTGWFRWDLSQWGMLLIEGVAGAIIAFQTDEINMLEGRRDLAVLWDIRVHPTHRGKGLGRQLFVAVEQWARTKGCTELKIETQQVNVDACRFYHSLGCELRQVHRGVYEGLPGEVQLLWYRVL